MTFFKDANKEFKQRRHVMQRSGAEDRVSVEKLGKLTYSIGTLRERPMCETACRASSRGDFRVLKGSWERKGHTKFLIWGEGLRGKGNVPPTLPCNPNPKESGPPQQDPRGSY